MKALASSVSKIAVEAEVTLSSMVVLSASDVDGSNPNATSVSLWHVRATVADAEGGISEPKFVLHKYSSMAAFA